MSDTSKTAKIIKSTLTVRRCDGEWYHLFMILLFSMCHSLHVAINKCINWCFVHLYLLFYYNSKVFMLMVNYKLSASHDHEDTEPYVFWRSRFWSFRSRVVIGTWPSGSSRALSYWWSMMTMNLSCTDTEIRGFKDFGVTSLTFWGHVTSSVTWLLDSAYVVSYWWSIVIMHLSCTVTEIWGTKGIVITTLTFWGHVTSSITWPSDSAWALSYWLSIMTMRLSCTYTGIRGFKDFAVTILTFWGHVTSLVTWPFYSAYVLSYWWSIGTIRLSCTVT